MREIKFRIWDKENKKWLENKDSGFFGITLDGQVLGVGEDYETNSDDDIFSLVTT